MQTLNVDLGERSYPIHIGPGLLEQPERLRAAIPGNSAVVVTNETVAPLYRDRLDAALEGLQVATVTLGDGERFKTMETVGRILDVLVEGRFDRRTTVIALGGGVVGDIAGFAAAIYQRGVHFIQVPTTLLAQVDSSVGGKTGVNHPGGKNLIGAFHQPRCVIADTDTLDTLDDRQLSAGLAEVIKYGLILDLGFLDWLEANMAGLRGRDAALLTEAIERSCRIKADVVARDERETGMRALLNLGHTFGHAIETATGYGTWLHGEAIGAGMCMAADLSHRQGWIHHADFERVERVMRAAGLPTEAPETLTAERFFELMQIDKKVVDGRLRLVLLERLGHAVVTRDFDPALLDQTLQAYCGPR